MRRGIATLTFFAEFHSRSRLCVRLITRAYATLDCERSDERGHQPLDYRTPDEGYFGDRADEFTAAA